MKFFKRVLWAILGFILIQPVLRSLVYSLVRTDNDRTRIDSIVVLGTAQYNGLPSRRFAARLRHAAQLWRQHEMQRVFTVGGKIPGDLYTEAEVGREYLVREGVDPDLIFVSPVGNDTEDSFAALDPEKVGTVLVVTDPTHAYRATRIARKLGFDAYSSPTPFSPTRIGSRSWFSSLIHEVGGTIVLDVSAVLGEDKADILEDKLRFIQSRFHPTRKARYEKLRKSKA